MKLKIYLTILILLSASVVASGAVAEMGIAVLSGTEPGSTISGIVTLQDTADGLLIRAEVKNVPAGKHGFHIHEFGLITNGGKDAGGHFNPDSNPHGYVVRDGVERAHAGDLGNIVVGLDGSGILELVVRGLTLSEGRYGVAGRAVILHAQKDDFGQPTGNTGGKIAGGSIVIKGD